MATKGSKLKGPFDINGDLHYSLADVPRPVATQAADCTEYPKRWTKLDNRFLPKQSNDLSLYKLMTQKAKSGESMLNYATRLRKFAEKCDFRDWSADKMIKCMVLVSMKDEELRLSLLEMDLRLDEVLDKVKMKEDTAMVSGENEGSGGHTSINSDSVNMVQKLQTKQKPKKNQDIVKKETHHSDQKDIEDNNMRSSILDPNKCFYCGDRFKDTVGLGSHMISHIGENYSSCDTCVKGFSQKADVLNHIVPHVSGTTNKDEQCSDSAEDFIEDELTEVDDFTPDLTVPEITQKADVLNHIVPHVSGAANKDEQCPDSAEDFIEGKVTEVDDFTPDLTVPEITNREEKPHKCFQCGKQYKRACTLNRHMRTHTHEKTHTCSECGKQFREACILKIHMRTHTGEKPHKCSQCNKQFTQVGALKTHMMTHTGEKPHVCSKCGKQFTKASDLRQHMRIHTGEKPHICSHCGNMFTQAGTLREHMKTHTGEKPYTCSDCGTAFRQSSTLKKHMMTHTGEKPHQCPYCGKQFIQIGTLRIHIKIHTGERPHDCCVCAKQFKTTGDLKLHMMIHTGERPHKCPQCGRQFVQGGALKEHMMTHTGEKPHQCSECTKCFIQKGELTIHMRTHTGEKPHKCSQCDKQFAQRGNLRAHMRTHTGEKPYQCSTCGLQFTQSSSLKRHKSTHTDEK